MHDIRLIRENPQSFDDGLARRGVAPQAAALLSLDEQVRAAIKTAEDIQAKANASAKAIGAAMGRGDRDEAERLKAEVAGLKTDLPQRLARYTLSPAKSPCGRCSAWSG